MNELESVSRKLVRKMSSYLMYNYDSNIMYMESNPKEYKEVDADIGKDRIACTFIVKDKILSKTKVYKFDLTPQLVKNAIERHYAYIADLFLVSPEVPMSISFVAARLDMLLDSTSIEDEYIYGTSLYMCALCYQDEYDTSKEGQELAI